ASIAIPTPETVDPVWAVADPTQLENALVNLSLNSRDAMPHGGTLTIAVGPQPDDAAVVGFDEPPAPGRYVEIGVGDTGLGFAPGAAIRAFEPFFTTKALGSGLGLSMVYGFVKQSGGCIRIDSAAGVGTTVTLLLPRADPPPVSAPGAVQCLEVLEPSPSEVGGGGGAEKKERRLWGMRRRQRRRWWRRTTPTFVKSCASN
ncbi:hypothetical protein JZU48_00785, partial [bacterium]|nr:hypothetical protein [bacterium]